MIQKHEVQSLMRAVSGVVRDYVSKSVAVISARLDEFDARIKAIPAGAQGETGANGKDADPEITRGLIASEVARQFSEMAKPSDGKDGRDGKDGVDGKDGRDPKPEEIQNWVRREVKEFVDALPKAKDGKDGVDGKDGIAGDAGTAGPAGIQGIPGSDGRDGKDADPELIRSMVAAAVAEALAAIPAAAAGAPGKDADPIHPDTLRLMVVEAVREEVRAIPAPKDGDPGQPGRDSLEIDILPSVDPAKSYPRGTFACHEGGLIRAIRNTEPIKESLFPAGWAVVVEGVSMFEVRQSEDLRSFSVRSCRTSGATETNEFRLPVLIYRGIFQEGAEYHRGDCVTWAGSTWHCEAETTKDKPGDGATDWRLMVKQGRPGKDAEPKRP
jgi:hypothetical protein